MRIQAIQIKNLWKKGNVYWEFDPNVNILVGNNGTGKSTIIKLINTCLKPILSEEDKYPFALIDEMIVSLIDEDDELHFIYIDSSGNRTPEKLLYPIKSNLISTFDINNSLDDLLKEAKIEYLAYESSLLSKMRDYLQLSKTEDTFDAQKNLFVKQELLIEKTNELFKTTGKFLAKNQTSDSKHFMFSLEGQINQIDHTQLSSGEKQLFYLFVSAMLQEEQAIVSFLDEPEISLHIDWQENLISFLRALNPKAQLVLVTHSPNVFFPAFAENMKRIEEILEEKPSFFYIPSKKEFIHAELLDILDSTKNKEGQLTKINIFLNKKFVLLSKEDADFILEFLKENNIEPDMQIYIELIDKQLEFENSANILSKFNKGNKYTSSSNAGIVNAVLTKIRAFDYQIDLISRSSNPANVNINTFSILLGNAQTSEDIETVEAYRKRFGIDKNEQYERKLKVKQ